ncbi:hypothetical protein [Actinomadura sp. 6N118]|uniref:hypothetical protein n=1 Tax=Actinomadura sp. 6N118 TaxID=3375151 RepID=UPI0037A5164F
MPRRRDLLLLSVALLVVVIVPAVLVAGCFRSMREEFDTAPDTEELEDVARSAAATQARHRAQAWVDEQIRFLTKARPWLVDHGGSVVDTCSAWRLPMSFTWSVSCERVVTRYFAADRELCDGVRQVSRWAFSRGWGTEPRTQCGAPVCPQGIRSRWTDPDPDPDPGAPARWAEIVTLWSGRECRPPATSLANDGYPTRSPYFQAEVRRPDLREVSTRALSTHRHFVQVMIKPVYFSQE